MAEKECGPAWPTGSSFQDRCVRQMSLLSCMKAKDEQRLMDITNLAGFDPDEIFSQDRETCSALCMAIENDWPEGLRHLLCAGADANRRTEIINCQFGWTRHVITPLMAAIQTGHMACACVLTQFGADVNHVDPYGHISSLHWAVYTNNPDAVRFLLTSTMTSCADVNVTGDDVNFTPLALAVENMGYKFVCFPMDPSIFVENDKVRQEQCLTILEMLLNTGANVNYCHPGSIPPPFLCATATDTRVMALFLRHGLDVNMTLQLSTLCPQHTWLNYYAATSIINSEQSLSLLTYYLLAGYFRVASMLVSFGADISSEDRTIILAAHEEESRSQTSPLWTNHKARFIQALHSHVTQPPSLNWLCRKAIRVQAGVSSEKAINHLPLPTVLKSYLMGHGEL